MDGGQRSNIAGPASNRQGLEARGEGSGESPTGPHNRTSQRKVRKSVHLGPHKGTLQGGLSRGYEGPGEGPALVESFALSTSIMSKTPNTVPSKS